MDKAILKKWWFWLAVLLIFGAVGSLGQTNDESVTSQDESQHQMSQIASNASVLDEANYEGKEGLVVYSELKEQGYNVIAKFENSALTSINGEASELFDALNIENQEDKSSVDNFIVKSIAQDGDNVELVIVMKNIQN